MIRELSLTGFGPFSSQTRAKFVGLKIIFKVYSPSLLAFDIDIDKSLSRARLFATLWTVAYQAPLSMGFSRQEYWSGLPFPSPENLLLDKLVNRNSYLTCAINFRGKQREKCTFYENNGMSTDGAFCVYYMMREYQAP